MWDEPPSKISCEISFQARLPVRSAFKPYTCCEISLQIQLTLPQLLWDQHSNLTITLWLTQVIVSVTHMWDQPSNVTSAVRSTFRLNNNRYCEISNTIRLIFMLTLTHDTYREIWVLTHEQTVVSWKHKSSLRLHVVVGRNAIWPQSLPLPHQLLLLGELPWWPWGLQGVQETHPWQHKLAVLVIRDVCVQQSVLAPLFGDAEKIQPAEEPPSTIRSCSEGEGHWHAPSQGGEKFHRVAHTFPELLPRPLPPTVRLQGGPGAHVVGVQHDFRSHGCSSAAMLAFHLSRLLHHENVLSLKQRVAIMRH